MTSPGHGLSVTSPAEHGNGCSFDILVQMVYHPHLQAQAGRTPVCKGLCKHVDIPVPGDCHSNGVSKQTSKAVLYSLRLPSELAGLWHTLSQLCTVCCISYSHQRLWRYKTQPCLLLLDFPRLPSER